MNAIAMKNNVMLDAYVARQGSGYPLPLKSVSYDIEVVSGLVVVVQKRTFSNSEAMPIEAVMTFPVPYDAVVTRVEAIVAGRRLVGMAKSKKAARETYENAIDEGKATVLHEELIRGLHMISAGNVMPGSEIVVECRFVQPMKIVAGQGRLRIPMTVGAIYGASPFLPSDDIVSGGPALLAEVTAKGASGMKLNGRDVERVMCVSTGAVMDFVIPTLDLVPLRAASVGGGDVVMTFSPRASEERDMDCDVLLDASGSMASANDGSDGIASRGEVSKWADMIGGLVTAAATVRDGDRFRAWTFSGGCTMHGNAVGTSVADLFRSLPFAKGGTELAAAVHRVINSGSERNILLVTDGLSYTPINFEAVRSSGSRFTVVLIGSSALEANVAQLAAVTGGELFVAAPGADVAVVVSAAFRSMRSASEAPSAVKTERDPVSMTSGGMTISAGFEDKALTDIRESDAAAGYAAFLSVCALPEQEAATLAEKAGIVSRLTSIVMVDEEGDVTEDIAVTRKQPLSEGGNVFFASAMSAAPQSLSLSVASTSSLRSARPGRFGSWAGSGGGDASMLGGGSPVDAAFDTPSFAGIGIVNDPAWGTPAPDVIMPDFTQPGRFVPAIYPTGSGDISPMIDWSRVAFLLNASDMSGLRTAFGGVFSRMASVPAIIDLALLLGVDPLIVAVAISAERVKAGERTARRIAGRTLKNAPRDALARAMAVI